MPYKSEKLKLSEAQDRRRKLTEGQRDEIKGLYSTGNFSLNNLAKMYDVSKKNNSFNSKCRVGREGKTIYTDSLERVAEKR